jgi:hypothetical protein
MQVVSQVPCSPTRSRSRGIAARDFVAIPRGIGALALILLIHATAHATGRDFIDETLVATRFGREFGVEMGADSRIDRDYRLQGWFTGELEMGLTRDLLVEAASSTINRGRGLEFGTWHAEARYLAFDQGRMPFALAAVGEYEVETRVAKHPGLERLLSWRGVATRTFAGSLLVTVNAGVARRLRPIHGTGRVYAFGVRYPDNGPIAGGFEYRENRLERETRLGPELRITLPQKRTLRLGVSFGQKPSPYRFIGRAIIETEL